MKLMSKKIRNFILGAMAFAAVALAFTSCNTDDDNDYGRAVTVAERSTAFANLSKNGISGTAKLYYADANSQSYTQTVDSISGQMNWYFTSDSTIVISGIPDSLFAQSFADLYPAMYTAIKEGTPATTTLTCNISYVYYNGQVIPFLNPSASNTTINLSNQTQTFRPLFYLNQYYIYANTQGRLVMNMVYAGYVLNSGSSAITIERPLAMTFLAQ